MMLSRRDKDNLYPCPAEAFEALAMTYFDVIPEQMRDQNLGRKSTSAMYNPKSDTYGFEAIGWGPGASPEITLNSVDDSKEDFLSCILSDLFLRKLWMGKNTDWAFVKRSPHHPVSARGWISLYFLYRKHLSPQ